MRNYSPLLLTLVVAAPAGEHCLLGDRYCSERLQASHEHLDVNDSNDVPNGGGRYAGMTAASSSTSAPVGSMASLRDWIRSS